MFIPCYMLKNLGCDVNTLVSVWSDGEFLFITDCDGDRYIQNPKCEEAVITLYKDGGILNSLFERLWKTEKECKDE